MPGLVRTGAQHLKREHIFGLRQIRGHTHMFAIIGVLVVIGAIVGGYLMEHGNLLVLMQPAELVIIGGAAAGTVLIANPLATVISIAKGALGVLKASPYTKAYYLEYLKMMYELFQYSRKYGAVKLEGDIEDPSKSEIFKKYPKFLADHHALHFVCDTLRMFVGGGVSPFELDQLMEMDMEVHHRGDQRSGGGAQHCGRLAAGSGNCGGGAGRGHYDGRAGRSAGRDWAQGGGGAGGNISRDPAVLRISGAAGGEHGQSQRGGSAALPLLARGVAAFVRGAAPILSVEFARRVIPPEVRPTFQETEKYCKQRADAAPEAVGAGAPAPATAG